ncbi:MAG: hypothetical protein N2Z21_08565 [Candidatus Sumerlaeaceae bacterium]|nr:hypothetical protein [Candidatus Sumerlaeaceae bacterium]
MAVSCKVSRNFNYTNRIRIDRHHVVIRPVNQESQKAEGLEVEFSIDLQDYLKNLDDQDQVIAEVYYKGFYARTELGEVSDFADGEKTVRAEFPNYYIPAERSRFRLKIVANGQESTQGLLLALADHLKLTSVPSTMEEEESESLRECDLLPVVYADLGEVPWIIDWEQLEQTILILNKRLFDKDKVNQPLYRALLLPAVLKDILTQILIIDEYDGDEDRNDWRYFWIDMVSERWMGGTRPPANGKGLEDKLDWIEEAIKGFCERNKLVSKVE